MAELYHGHRIYTTDEREKVVPVAFKFDDILDIRSGKGVGLDFENCEPKTQVMLTGDRTMWLIVPFSKFRRLWESYLQDDDVPCDCERCTPKAVDSNSFPQPSAN